MGLSNGCAGVLRHGHGDQQRPGRTSTVACNIDVYECKLAPIAELNARAEQDDDALDEVVTITLESTYQWKDDLPGGKYVLRTHTVSRVVTVRVDDDETLTNNAPTVSSAIPDQAVASGGTGTVTLSSHFSDADSGDTLTYAAESAFPALPPYPSAAQR